MKHKSLSHLFFVAAGMLVVLTTLLLLVPNMNALAEPLAQVNDGSKCVTCHEDLYYLHDTGKAFCLQDSPMRCIDCHGGNPDATTKEEAHFNREAHPIINDDNKKCYECHPASAEERTLLFDKLAGINPVIVAEPCITPENAPAVSATAQAAPADSTGLTLAIILAGLGGLIMVSYFLFKVR